MALKTALRPISRRIAGAVKQAAAAQGLPPGDFALVGSFNERTEHISLTIATDRQVDELCLYTDALREIRQAFPDDPYFTMHVGIVVQRVQNLDEAYWDFGMGENDIDMTPLFEKP